MWIQRFCSTQILEIKKDQDQESHQESNLLKFSKHIICGKFRFLTVMGRIDSDWYHSKEIREQYTSHQSKLGYPDKIILLKFESNIRWARAIPCGPIGCAARSTAACASIFHCLDSVPLITSAEDNANEYCNRVTPGLGVLTSNHAMPWSWATI